VKVNERPIGVFDSGVGGLTVVRALRAALPGEPLIYLGDTARVPYGSKSAETVRRYSRMAAGFLLGRGVKMLVVACNTASAFALDDLAAHLPVPVLGVVEPGARAALAATRAGRIGVLGTLGTIRSGAYPRAIAALPGGDRVSVETQPCPLLVPLAEEGWTDDAIAEAVVTRYLDALAARAPDLDVLVLGCTHYPLLREVIGRVARARFGHEVALVDSAVTMARAIGELLQARALLGGGGGEAVFCVTDEARIDEIGARFLGHPLGPVERVDL
jgi:glutamate racemase